MKRYKRGARNRRKAVFLLLLVLVFIAAASPFLWHGEHLRTAKHHYDLEKVQRELGWFSKFGGPLKHLAMIRDAGLWLDLNLGTEGVEGKLQAYPDDQHQFWLSVYYLQEGDLAKGENVLAGLSEKNLEALGQGLLLLARGDYEECRQELGGNDVNWAKMRPEEQTLRYLTLGRGNLALDDLGAAQSALDAAQDLSPQNPACLMLAFDLAVKKEQWTKADELSQAIDAQTWRPLNPLYETKKALLALQLGNQQNFDLSLSALGELPQGDVRTDYLKGIAAIKEGDWTEGKGLLEKALTNGLEGELRSDAQKAVDQINERQQAEQSLRGVVAAAGEHW